LQVESHISIQTKPSTLESLSDCIAMCSTKENFMQLWFKVMDEFPNWPGIVIVTTIMFH